MADIIASVSVTDIPLMRNIITALADSAVLLRDAQCKLSNAVRADDPIVRRIDGMVDHIEKLSECVPDKQDADGDPDIIRVPVNVAFDASRTVGELRMRRDALPPVPDWHLALGYRIGEPYELVEVAILPDVKFRAEDPGVLDAVRDHD